MQARRTWRGTHLAEDAPGCPYLTRTHPPRKTQKCARPGETTEPTGPPTPPPTYPSVINLVRSFNFNVQGGPHREYCPSRTTSCRARPNGEEWAPLSSPRPQLRHVRPRSRGQYDFPPPPLLLPSGAGAGLSAGRGLSLLALPPPGVRGGIEETPPLP